MATAIQNVYVWQVLHHNGETTPEYDEAAPSGRSFAAVDTSSVSAISLLSLVRPSVSVRVPEGATPVFFRRKGTVLSLVTGEEQRYPTVHCIGWKREEAACYLFIDEGGNILLTDDFQAV